MIEVELGWKIDVVSVGDSIVDRADVADIGMTVIVVEIVTGAEPVSKDGALALGELLALEALDFGNRLLSSSSEVDIYCEEGGIDDDVTP